MLSSVVILAACSNRPSPEGELASQCSYAPYQDETALDGIAGTYELSLEANRGPRSSQSTEGELHLISYPEQGIELPSWAEGSDVRILFYGGTDIILGEVGAAANGSRSSMDPEEAGVLAIGRIGAASEGWTVTIRMGSRSNRFDRPPIEGPYMAMTLTELCVDSFSGTWSSGGAAEEASGTFAALRPDF